MKYDAIKVEVLFEEMKELLSEKVYFEVKGIVNYHDRDYIEVEIYEDNEKLNSVSLELDLEEIEEEKIKIYYGYVIYKVYKSLKEEYPIFNQEPNVDIYSIFTKYQELLTKEMMHNLVKGKEVKKSPFKFRINSVIQLENKKTTMNLNYVFQSNMNNIEKDIEKSRKEILDIYLKISPTSQEIGLFI